MTALARRYAETLEVRRRDDAPAQFVWRGRLHVVREVLDRWTVTGAWWTQAAVRRMTDTAGLEAGSAASGGGTGRAATGRGGSGRGGSGETALPELVLQPLPPSPKWGQRAWAEPAPDIGVSVLPAGLDDDEREFWRVEASSGRDSPTTVVELCFAWSTGVWTLTAVLD